MCWFGLETALATTKTIKQSVIGTAATAAGLLALRIAQGAPLLHPQQA